MGPTSEQGERTGADVTPRDGIPISRAVTPAKAQALAALPSGAQEQLLASLSEAHSAALSWLISSSLFSSFKGSRERRDPEEPLFVSL